MSTEYKVLHSSDIEALECAVKKAIDIGWIVSGGVSVYDGTGYQTLTRTN